jgi:pentapeptide MXKDX repeat protein
MSKDKITKDKMSKDEITNDKMSKDEITNDKMLKNHRSYTVSSNVNVSVHL